MENEERDITFESGGIKTDVEANHISMSLSPSTMEVYCFLLFIVFLVFIYAKTKKNRKHRKTKTNDSDTNSNIELVETKDVTQNKPICVYFRSQNKVFLTDRIQYGSIKCYIPRTIDKFRPKRELNVVEFVRIALDLDSRSPIDLVRVLKRMNKVDKVTPFHAFFAEHIIRLYEWDNFNPTTWSNYITYAFPHFSDMMRVLICLFEPLEFTDKGFILAKMWLAVAMQKRNVIRHTRRFMCEVLRMSKHERQKQQNEIDSLQRWIDLSAEAEVKEALERAAIYLDCTTLTIDHMRHFMLSSRINDFMYLRSLFSELNQLLTNASFTQVIKKCDKNKYLEFCCEVFLTNMQCSNPFTMHDGFSALERQNKYMSDMQHLFILIKTIIDDRRMLSDFEAFIRMYSSVRQENTGLPTSFCWSLLHPTYSYLNVYLNLFESGKSKDRHTYLSRLLDIKRQTSNFNDSINDIMFHSILHNPLTSREFKTESIAEMTDKSIGHWLRSEQHRFISTETRQAHVSHVLRIKNRTCSFYVQQADLTDTNSGTSLSEERSIEKEVQTGRNNRKKKRKHRQTQVNDSDTDCDIEPIDIAEIKYEEKNEPFCVYFRDQLHVFTTGTEKEHDGLNLNDMEVLKHRNIPETKEKKARFLRGPFFALTTESGSTDLSDECHRPYEAEPDEDLF